MFDFFINTLLTELNAYSNAKTGLTEERIIYAHPQEQAKLVDDQAANKVVMSLVDLLQESLNSGAKAYIPQGNKYITKNQPLTFSFYLLFATYFKANQALEGLRYLTSVIAFFQSKNHFTQQNTPALQQADLDNLSIDLVNLNYQEKSALWTYLGTSYRPSVLYKVGMISVADQTMGSPEIAAIHDIAVRT